MILNINSLFSEIKLIFSLLIHIGIIYLNTITTHERVGDDIFFDNTYISPIEGKLVLFPSDWTFPYKHNCSLLEDKYILKGEIALLSNNA